MVRSYTEMSDVERKQLIEEALAAKEELEEKKKERVQLAHEVEDLKGLLLDGEKEALAQQEVVKFALKVSHAI